MKRGFGRLVVVALSMLGGCSVAFSQCARTTELPGDRVGQGIRIRNRYGERDHAQREYAETAHRSANALLTIINDILDFSKIEAGKMLVEPIPFDLRMAVEDMAEIISSKAREKGLDLIVRFSPETPSRVIGDPGRIRQILINLCGNAVKFTSKWHVYLSVECEERSGERARIRFSVADTGIGIPASKLANASRTVSEQ
jgi:signal transduction histidine kinase